MPFQHEKSKERATEMLANTYLCIHLFVGISVGVSGATYWSNCSIGSVVGDERM